MPHNTKQSIFILLFLVIVFAIYAFFLNVQNQKAGQSISTLEVQLTEAKNKEQQAVSQLADWQKKAELAKQEKTTLEEKLRLAEDKTLEIKSSLSDIDKMKEDWQKRFDELAKERDELKVKLAQKPEPQIIYKEAEPKVIEKVVEVPTSKPPEGVYDKSDEYWAGVLQDKAELEIQVKRLREELSKGAVEVTELKQQAIDLQMKVDQFENNKLDIDQAVRYKTDIINNLSMELAQSKNERKFTVDRVKKMEGDTASLRHQIKQLISSKAQLEKTIVRLNDEKNELNTRLVSTQNVIQSKIDEIWQVKDSIDQSFATAQINTHGNEVELSPIIVNSNAPHFAQEKAPTGFSGRVVSVNIPNNFIVVDLGSTAGVAVGDKLSVYRGNENIAQVEVIQVRQEISAADIKQQWQRVNVGDTIK